MREVLAAAAGAAALSTTKVESAVDTTFASLAAFNAGDAGSHGVEKPPKLAGVFSECACTIDRPSATMSAKPNAKLAHLRIMVRSYTRRHVGAIDV